MSLLTNILMALYCFYNSWLFFFPTFCHLQQPLQQRPKKNSPQVRQSIYFCTYYLWISEEGLCQRDVNQSKMYSLIIYGRLHAVVLFFFFFYVSIIHFSFVKRALFCRDVGCVTVFVFPPKERPVLCLLVETHWGEVARQPSLTRRKQHFF